MNGGTCTILTILSDHFSEIIIAGMGITSSILSYRFAKSQKVFEINISRREALYVEMIEILERLRDDYSLVFSKEYIDTLKRIKPKMKLLAEDEVVEKFKLIWKNVMTTYYAYLDYKKEVSHNNGLDSDFVETVDENGWICYVGYQPTEDDFERYEAQMKEYKDNNRCDIDDLNSKINDLIKAMRKSIKVEE